MNRIQSQYGFNVLIITVCGRLLIQLILILKNIKYLHFEIINNFLLFMHIIEYLRNNYLLYININNNIIYVMHILIRFKILNLLQCNIQQEYIIYILHICVKIVRIATLYNFY